MAQKPPDEEWLPWGLLPNRGPKQPAEGERERERERPSTLRQVIHKQRQREGNDRTSSDH